MAEVCPQPIEPVGTPDAPIAGRAWVRTFAGGLSEVCYCSGLPVSQVEQFNAWAQAAELGTRVVSFAPPGVHPEPKPKPTPEENRERAMRRARQRLRWSVKAIEADHLVTLTYRANVSDFGASRKHFARFVAMCRKRWPDFKFVGVPELQQRGAWHWHLAVRGRYDYNVLRLFWWRAVGERARWVNGKPVLTRRGAETPGNVDGQMCRRRWSDQGRWQADRMAAYLAKYLSKGFADTGGDGRHAYAVSRGLTWRVERYAVRALTFDEVAGVVFRLADGWAGVSVYQRPDSGLIWLAGRSPPEKARPG